METKSNYLIFRGKCKEVCEAVQKVLPNLILIRGHYYCAQYGKQEHWWLKTPTGNIVDPTKLQFPDQNGEYVEFDGNYECDHCGKVMKEEDATVIGKYIVCSLRCAHHLVM